MLVCRYCKKPTLARARRSFGDKLKGVRTLYECQTCGRRQTILKPKRCWRCRTELDRRKRKDTLDQLAALLRLWPYSCRLCGARRFRWGKRDA